jgi:hypothetical protein
MRKELAGELKGIRNLKEFKCASFSKSDKFISPKHAGLLAPVEVYKLIKIRDLSRIHSLYSNHIHSEYISLRQLNSALKQADEYESSISTVLSICSRITSLVITNMNTQYQYKRGSYFKSSISDKKLSNLLMSYL